MKVIPYFSGPSEYQIRLAKLGRAKRTKKYMRRICKTVFWIAVPIVLVFITLKVADGISKEKPYRDPWKTKITWTR